MAKKETKVALKGVDLRALPRRSPQHLPHVRSSGVLEDLQSPIHGPWAFRVWSLKFRGIKLRVSGLRFKGLRVRN